MGFEHSQFFSASSVIRVPRARAERGALEVSRLTTCEATSRLQPPAQHRGKALKNSTDAELAHFVIKAKIVLMPKLISN